jgi:hypothetical protein
MTADEVVRRLRAFEKGRPLPRGETLRVRRLPPDQQLVVAFVKMGGESAPWGMGYGRPGGKRRFLTIPEPRTRDDVAQMMAEFAPALLTHLHHPDFSSFGRDPEARVPPFQVWIPNGTHLEMLHHIAYAYTFTKFGPAERFTRLNQLGHACGWLFRESQRPGQMIAMVATEGLKEAYSFPAENSRLGHLGFLLAWLETKGSREARMQAAADAERLSIATNLDPAEERDELAPYVQMFNDARKSGDQGQLDRATRRIQKLLIAELDRRMDLTERAMEVLRRDKRRENKGVGELMKLSMDEHRLQFRRIEVQAADKEDGPAFRPSPETDRHPSAAGSRFYVQEASDELRDLLLVHDDREMQAELVARGEAIAGTITAVRDEGTGRKCVPVWTVESEGELPLRLRENVTVCVVGLRGRELRIRDIERTPKLLYRFELEVISLKKEIDEGRLPAANSKKLVGERVVLVKPSMDQIARRRSWLIWKRDVPGAWLTHRVPKVREADIPDEVAEDLTTLQGAGQ